MGVQELLSTRVVHSTLRIVLNFASTPENGQDLTVHAGQRGIVDRTWGSFHTANLTYWSLSSSLE
jgi:hypothetical protein